jgi:molybdopterin synthase sulfur carrier subunit
MSLGNDAGNIAVMAVIVRIPTTMRPLTGGDKQVSVEPGTLSEIVTELESAHPGLGDRLIDEDGALRKFVNIFVDDDDVRYLDGLDTKVADGITVSIIPAVAGG